MQAEEDDRCAVWMMCMTSDRAALSAELGRYDAPPALP
jgi:hypothetical protein